jgi:NADH:ubiquinone oxidoreductase subunit 5 (subunit L)/multisubunit Na+/H+ antiporter MnhA subunit
MFLASAPSYAAGIFHLMTHAFSRRCCFWPGSVIHGMEGIQDIWKMGAAASHAVDLSNVLVGTIAIAGLPPRGLLHAAPVYGRVFGSLV